MEAIYGAALFRNFVPNLGIHFPQVTSVRLWCIVAQFMEGRKDRAGRLKIRATANFPCVRLHDLRHTFEAAERIGGVVEREMGEGASVF